MFAFRNNFLSNTILLHPFLPTNFSRSLISQDLSSSFIASFPSQFTVVSDSYVTATLPPGGILGPVTVRLASKQEVSTLVDFRVIPTIGSVMPNNGSVGTSVEIVGTSFINNGQKGVIKVTFGGGKAAVLSVDNWAQITATVPACAVTGKIQVTTWGGTATSPTVFTVN
jgi:hypothetical protein